jgi:hypothetical protein
VIEAVRRFGFIRLADVSGHEFVVFTRTSLSIGGSFPSCNGTRAVRALIGLRLFILRREFAVSAG